MRAPKHCTPTGHASHAAHAHHSTRGTRTPQVGDLEIALGDTVLLAPEAEEEEEEECASQSMGMVQAMWQTASGERWAGAARDNRTGAAAALALLGARSGAPQAG